MLPINDRSLWGNEAADDEDPNILNSYFVSQPTFRQFFNPDVRLSIARARKGMGKSALLSECAYRVQEEENTVVISIKGADLAAQRNSSPTLPDEYIYDWQQRICMIINRQLGTEIGFAFNDDEMVLVETAELSGYKRRNLIGALVDRLKGKLGPIELQKLEAANPKALLKRVVSDKDWKVWVLIDDIDATFQNTPEQYLRLSTFFSACRDLSTSFKGVLVRTCVRTDVWASIRKKDEALDKVEQYIFDIQWSNRHTGVILAERIKSYLRNRESSFMRRDVNEIEGTESNAKMNELLKPLKLVFPDFYPWGADKVNSYRVIHVYGAGRPRWAAQLCRMAGQEAVNVNDRLIKFGHIKQVLEAYSRYRLDDIAREHRHQCEELALIVNAFSRGMETYSTVQLLAFIRDKILLRMKVAIDGIVRTDDVSIARFLFATGFLVAKGRKGNELQYYSFEDRPDLLISVSNLDDGLAWYVHPSFQAALKLKR